MKFDKWLKMNTQSLKGKRIAITGSTGGLGRHLCSYLAGLGASLILLDRNSERSNEHRNILISKYPESEIFCVNLDLEDIASADKVVSILIDLDIDIFIHNAGAYSIPRHKTSCSYDNVFQINFATPYFMIRRLLPFLQAKNGRVIAVGSIAHNYSKIDTCDIDFSTRSASSKVYGNAKRYLMFSLHRLFKDEKTVKLSIVHPGITFTNITSHYPKLIFAIIKHPMKIIFMKPKKAALCILKGVFESTDYLYWIGPSFFDIWGIPKLKKLKTCSDHEAKLIGEIAEKVYLNCCSAAKKE